MGSSTFLPFTSLLMVAVLLGWLHTRYEDRESRGSGTQAATHLTSHTTDADKAKKGIVIVSSWTEKSCRVKFFFKVESRFYALTQ